MSRVPQRISRNLCCELRRRAFTTTAERCLDRTRASTKVRAMAEKTLNIGEFKLAKPQHIPLSCSQICITCKY